MRDGISGRRTDPEICSSTDGTPGNPGSDDDGILPVSRQPGCDLYLLDGGYFKLSEHRDHHRTGPGIIHTTDTGRPRPDRRKNSGKRNPPPEIPNERPENEHESLCHFRTRPVADSPAGEEGISGYHSGRIGAASLVL